MVKKQFQKPEHALSKVKELAKNGQVDIWGSALRTASDDFGWKREDIISAIMNLNQQKHFAKADPSNANPGEWVDFYRAPKLYQGEDVFTHLYVEEKPNGDEILVVNSFKQL